MKHNITAALIVCGLFSSNVALAQFPERQRKMKQREVYEQEPLVNENEGTTDERIEAEDSYREGDASSSGTAQDSSAGESIHETTDDLYAAREKRRADKEPKGDQESWFFPPWGAPQFDWIIHPAAGFKAENDKTSTFERQSASTELGLRFAMNGVPIVSGNPGFYLKPQVGYAAGTYNTKLKPVGGSEVKSNGNFTRYFYGTDMVLLLGFFKNTFGVTAGTLKYSGDRTDKFHSLNFLEDVGILIMPNLSTHLTLDYVTAYEDRFSKPTIQEKDHWLHLKVFFDYFNINFDTGPGFSTVDLWATDASGNRSKIGDGTTNYYLTLFNMDLYWKLGLSARINYVYDAPEFNAAASTLVAENRLPTQSLNDGSAISTLPDDSLDSQFFIGARNLYAGLGVGYNYHVLQLNYSEKHGRKRQTYRDQGISVTYDVAF